MTETIQYSENAGKYGLHRKDLEIFEINSYSETTPQELHFKVNGKGKWAYVEDFITFSDSVEELEKIRKRLKKARK
ncbi:MAG: hypothetical protein ACOCRO_03160 [Halanaerobiales bacterium]